MVTSSFQITVTLIFYRYTTPHQPKPAQGILINYQVISLNTLNLHYSCEYLTWFPSNHSHLHWSANRHRGAGYSFFLPHSLATEPCISILFIVFKHDKFKTYGTTTSTCYCKRCIFWRLQCWHGNCLQHSRTSETTRFSSTNMLNLPTYSSRAKASDCVWPPLLQAVHRTTDKWKVQS